jgi:hypothetical protein
MIRQGRGRENRGVLLGCAVVKAGIVGSMCEAAGERSGTERRLLHPPTIEKLRADESTTERCARRSDRRKSRSFVAIRVLKAGLANDGFQAVMVKFSLPGVASPPHHGGHPISHAANFAHRTPDITQ